MAVERELNGRRVAVLVADGFEKVELTVPVAALGPPGQTSTSSRCATGTSAASICTSRPAAWRWTATTLC